MLLHSPDAVSPDSRWDIISAAPESVLVLDSQQQHAGNVLQYGGGIALLADLRINLATLANVAASGEAAEQLTDTRSTVSQHSDHGEAAPPFRWGALGYRMPPANPTYRCARFFLILVSPH